MTVTPEIVEFKGFLWIVKAKFPERIGKTDGYDFDFLKEKYRGDIVLRKSDSVYVCEIIEDIEFEEL